MGYKQTTIRSVVDEMNLSYFVPDIQRDYVWLQNPRAKKIEQLFDSLMRDYPIGTFLFWELKRDDIDNGSGNNLNAGKLNFQLYKFIENYDVRKPNNEKINISQIRREQLHIVLDGQQRLTSLYIGLRGTRCLKRSYARANDPNPYETKWLYLNLLYKPSDENPDDSYEFEFKTPEEVKVENDSKAKLWLRVGEVLNLDDWDAVCNFCASMEYPPSVYSTVEKLRQKVCDECVISYFEEQKKSLDKVLKIFIRVNSGGMQLSYSDLLMSLLTATFQSDIREDMWRVVSDMKAKGFDCFGRDQILKTCMMLSGCSHVFKLENFNKNNIKNIESNWDDVITCLNATVALLKKMGYTNQLSSGYIIAVISLYLYKKKVTKPSNEEFVAMKQFVQVAQMRSFFTTSLDTKLAEIKKYIEDSTSFAEFLNKMNSLPTFGIDNKYLIWVVDNVKYGSPAVLPVLQLLYPNLKYESVSFHIDHIYPKSKFNKKNVYLPPSYLGIENGLWNLQLLEGVENEEKNDADPEVWLQKKDAAERKEFLKANYINENFVLDWQNISEFEKERKAKILEQLQKVFGIDAE